MRMTFPPHPHQRKHAPGVWVNEVVPEFVVPAVRDYYNSVIERIRFYGKLVALNPVSFALALCI
jgi:hypothetical protein